MSLDVTLLNPNPVPCSNCSPCSHCDNKREYLEDEFSANITHNLTYMAGMANLYQPLWKPEEMGITYARQLIEPLKAGLEKLKADPEKFKKFNPENGWGSYQGLVQFVSRYLKACQDYPESLVRASR